tara:strand:- start:4436 stop:5056 length:621 start_codon:yes stop_codon:yes gene_type:complete
MKLLHIDASSNPEGNSRAITRYLVDQLNAEQVVTRDVAQTQLPVMDAETLLAFYQYADGAVVSPSTEQHLALSDTLIEELKAADVVVLGIPMYNFGVPIHLKNWIDHVARSGVTFRYGENGPEGLIGETAIYVVATSGGTPIGSDYDFSSRHAQQVFTFLGASSIDVIDASGSKGSPQEVVAAAKAQIDELLVDRIREPLKQIQHA